MPYPRNRWARIMYEARNANKLFRAPGAFAFRPTWRRPSAGLPSSMYRRHARQASTYRTRKLFKSRRWPVKRKSSRKGLSYKRYGRGKGRGASMLKVRKSDKEWVKFAKMHGLKV
jgi:hypothetical protein